MKAPSPPPPLLDRFLGQAGPLSFEAYAGIVLRDAEDLLNTRLSSPLGEEGGAAYGLPDLTVAGRTGGEFMKLAGAVRHCLETYEPRLKNIRVEARPPDQAEIDSLTIYIEAALTGFENFAPLSLELPVKVWNKVF